jgi:hypothetical protein
MYKVGYNMYGIEILRVHKEHVLFNYKKNRWKYYPTQYYTKIGQDLWFYYEYELNTIIGKREYICLTILKIVKELKIKLMLD